MCQSLQKGHSSFLKVFVQSALKNSLLAGVSETQEGAGLVSPDCRHLCTSASRILLQETVLRVGYTNVIVSVKYSYSHFPT